MRDILRLFKLVGYGSQQIQIVEYSAKLLYNNETEGAEALAKPCCLGEFQMFWGRALLLTEPLFILFMFRLEFSAKSTFSRLWLPNQILVFLNKLGYDFHRHLAQRVSGICPKKKSGRSLS